jgi:hypothetical protein
MVLAALLAVIASASAMRLNPLAVSSMVEDRRHQRADLTIPWSRDATADIYAWQWHQHIGPVPILAATVPRVGKSYPDPLTPEEVSRK